MERLQAEVEALNAEVRRLREEVSETEKVRDISEKLASGLADTAEQAREVAKAAHERLRQTVVILALGLLVWTPVVAYGAVWWHELIRNQCYPAVALVEGGPVDEPWYCGVFPGTNRHPHSE